MKKCSVNSSRELSLQLRQAAAKGELDKVKQCCRPETVNSKSSNGNTALHWAFLNGHHSTGEYLASYPNTELDSTNNEGRTAMHINAIKMCKKGTRILLKYGAGKTNYLDKEGYSPLDYACEATSSYLCVLLTHFRPQMPMAKMDQTAEKGFRRFIINNPAIIKNQEIFDQNYFFDAQEASPGGISPYYQPGNRFSLREMQMAVRNKILDVNKLFCSGTLLHSAAVSRVDVIEKFKWLFLAGANPNLQASHEINAACYKNTAAHTLVANEDETDSLAYIELAFSLEGDKKLNLNLTDSEGKTLLCLATKVGLFSVVRKLLSLGADPDSTDELGNSALHYALLLGHVTIADELINHQANKAILNKANLTALGWLLSSSPEDVIDCLEEIWIDPSRKIGPHSKATYLESCLVGRTVIGAKNEKEGFYSPDNASAQFAAVSN